MSKQKLFDKTYYVRSNQMRIRIRQIKPRIYLLSGVPADEGPVASDRICDDLTEMEGVYAKLGLIDGNSLGAVAKRALRPLWGFLEQQQTKVPDRQPWSTTRKVRKWHH